MTYEAREVFRRLGSDVWVSVLQAIEDLGKPIRLIVLHRGSHVPGRSSVATDDFSAMAELGKMEPPIPAGPAVLIGLLTERSTEISGIEYGFNSELKSCSYLKSVYFEKGPKDEIYS